MSTCPQASSLEPNLANVGTHMGGHWYIPNMDSESAKARCLAKGNLEKNLIKVIQSTTRTRRSVLASVCLFTCTLFPPNKCFTCFTSFGFSVEIHFLEMNPNGQDSALGLTSISGQKPKSCFKSLQVEATQAQTCLHKNLCLSLFRWKQQQQQKQKKNKTRRP